MTLLRRNVHMIRPQRQRGIVGYVPQQRFNATWPDFVACVPNCSRRTALCLSTWRAVIAHVQSTSPPWCSQGGPGEPGWAAALASRRAAVRRRHRSARGRDHVRRQAASGSRRGHHQRSPTDAVAAAFAGHHHAVRLLAFDWPLCVCSIFHTWQARLKALSLAG